MLVENAFGRIRASSPKDAFKNKLKKETSNLYVQSTVAEGREEEEVNFFSPVIRMNKYCVAQGISISNLIWVSLLGN